MLKRKKLKWKRNLVKEGKVTLKNKSLTSYQRQALNHPHYRMLNILGIVRIEHSLVKRPSRALHKRNNKNKKTSYNHKITKTSYFNISGFL